jgi:nucleotide-binding universal stress UspA family protein
LIVVGSPRLGRLHRAFRGSTGAATSAKAVCPVVVVRKRASRSLSGTRVVVGVGGPASRNAAKFAFQEARRTNAGLTAVHAWHLNTADLASLVSPVDGRQELEVRAQAMLAEVLGPLSVAYPEVDVRRYVVEGSPAELLEELSTKARLLVVGSRGLSRLSALLLGSCPARRSRTRTAPWPSSTRAPRPSPQHIAGSIHNHDVSASTLVSAMAHPFRGQGVLVQRVRSEVRDAADMGGLLRRGRLPRAWIAPPATGSGRSWSGTGPSWSRSARAATVRCTQCWIGAASRR